MCSKMNKKQLYSHCKSQEEEIQRLTLFNDDKIIKQYHKMMTNCDKANDDFDFGTQYEKYNPLLLDDMDHIPYYIRQIRKEKKELQEKYDALIIYYHKFLNDNGFEVVEKIQEELNKSTHKCMDLEEKHKEEIKEHTKEIKFQKKIFKSIVLQAIRNDNDHYEEFLDDGGNEFIRYSDYLAESPEDFKKVEIFMRNIMLSLNCGDLDAFEEEMSVGYKNGNLFISFDDTDSSDEED